MEHRQRLSGVASSKRTTVRVGRIGGAVIAVLTLALASCAGSAGAPALTVTDARLPMPAGANGAVYLTVTNGGDTADRLVGIRTDAADAAELHESSMSDGTVSMTPVQAIELPAGGQAVLEPGGLHIMLVHVDQDLTVGDAVDVTLVFDTAPEQTVAVEVVPLGDASAGHDESTTTHDDG